MITGEALLASACFAGGTIAALTAPQAHAGDLNRRAVIEITANEFAFTSPEVVDAGLVTFRLVNRGNQLHHLQFVRLARGKTIADILALPVLSRTGPFPDWMTDVVGPNPSVLGRSTDTTVQLDPGSYAIICLIPGSDVLPHTLNGMIRPLAVLSAVDPRPTAVPASDVSVTLKD